MPRANHGFRTQPGSRPSLRTTLLALPLLAVIALALAPQLAQGAVHKGNWCAARPIARWYVANVGAEACIKEIAVKPHASITLEAGAFDYAKDGYSPLNDTRIEQLVNRTWITTYHFSFFNPGGYGTTDAIGPVTIPRRSGASGIRVSITACTYDNLHTHVRESCGSKHWSYPW